MISEGYRTQGGVNGPMKFKKKDVFFRKIVLPGFWDPGCHACKLSDLVNTALVRKDSAKNMCIISEGYKAHRGVTGPMNFKKLGKFFGKSCSWDFGAADCHPSTLIDIINTALANRGSVEIKCMIAEVYRAHSVVTGPMNFKKSGHFVSGKSCSRGFGAPGCHPGTLIDLVNVALDSRDSLETICMIWEGCRTHRVVTGPMNFKKSGFFSENHAPGFLGPLAAMQAF